MENPILRRIAREGFAVLGYFEPDSSDHTPGEAKSVILIGNAGPDMFRRFARVRGPSDSLDEWTRGVIDPLAQDLDAQALYPFDKPAHPFLTWARRGGGGHTSPLGLNIHPTYGLWHAYRAALLFPVAFDLPPVIVGSSPCNTCADKPCLSACPVQAFDGSSYDVAACGQHILSDAGQACMKGGCKARLACPVGKAFTYEAMQMQFHMKAFQSARAAE
jgi:hypothetical protein